MPLLAEGQSIRDTYEVERFLGEGAFAEVYRVRHRFLGRQAMKVFKKEGMSAPEVEAALSEAILLSRIGHPNIVRVFDANAFESPSGLRGYFTMEFVAGGTLDAFCRASGSRTLPVATAVDLARQVCRGLTVAHGESPPVVHRDIKPQNVLVGREPDGSLRARIGDFGLARRVNPLTLLASAAGTLAFKPPEVFADAKSDSPAGDVYAVGVTLYLFLSGRFPYEIGPDYALVSPDDFARPPRPLPELNLDVDDALAAVVSRAIARAPADRYPDARALLAALEAWAPERPGNVPSAQEEKHTDLFAANAAHENAKAVRPGQIRVPRQNADALVRHALAAARESSRLADAAALMEEAFALRPALREKYASRVKLWRAGVSM